MTKLERAVENAVCVRIAPKGKTVTFGEEKHILAKFTGVNASRDAGVYRRKLVDGIIEVVKP
jgi:hypothetical protein